MTQWKGQSQSPLIGFKVYVYFIRHFGIGFAYVVLAFVALYFLLVVKTSRRASLALFRYRLQYGYFKALVNTYITNFRFGQTLIDRVAMSIGKQHSYSFEFDGKNHLKHLIDCEQGGVLLTGHVGNFNVAHHFLKLIDNNSKIKMVVTDREHKAIKSYFESISQLPSIDFIVLKEDFSHTIPMAQAIKNKAILVFAADRYLEGVPTLKANFLDKPVHYPEGPFKLIQRHQLPVCAIYCMRESNRHYHLYARPLTTKNKDSKTVLKMYLQSLEHMVKKYPNQWFNFYDYWNDYRHLD